MDRLGYDRYLAHGGDFGAAVSRELGLLEPEKVIGVHLTELAHGIPDPQDVREDEEAERAAVGARQRYVYDLSGYMWVQTQRPPDACVRPRRLPVSSSPGSRNASATGPPAKHPMTPSTATCC